MQIFTLSDRDDLQMRLEQRKIPRPHRGQETIAVMLVLIYHVGRQLPTNSNRNGDGDHRELASPHGSLSPRITPYHIKLGMVRNAERRTNFYILFFCSQRGHKP